MFFARFLALLRILGGLMAGAMRMPFVKFSIANLAGGVLWAATFATLGYEFGRNLPELERRIGLASGVLAVVVVIAIAGLLIYRRRTRSSA